MRTRSLVMKCIFRIYVLSASTAGTEQFGINLVANTSPVSFGANPVAQPDGDTSFTNGAASAGYNTTNQYKYVVGDTIANAPSGKGRTNFTVAYLANISSITEAGLYTMNHDMVATPTF